MEFLNRFNGIVAFRPLTDIQATTVARRMLDDFVAHLTREKKLTLTYDPAVVDVLAQVATRSRFGARAIQHEIDETVASYVAREILTRNLTAGDTLHVHPAVLSV
jgi:ATP-dependent Clp protease ATP-binding subunit ClpA